MMSENIEVIEWWLRYQPSIDGKFIAKDGLRKRRKALEEIVALYVTTRKTRDAILFQGKRRYVKTFDPGKETNHIWSAIWALQFLYNIEAAREAEDIDKLIRMTYGFALHDFAVTAFERWKVSIWTVLPLWDLARRQYVDRGKKSKKLGTEHDNDLQVAYDKYCGNKDWLRCITREMRDRHKIQPLSTKTVSRRLRELGIVDNDGVVLGQR